MVAEGATISTTGRSRTDLVAADLVASVAFGDARYADLCTLIRKSCTARGAKVPEMPPPPVFSADPLERLALDGLGFPVQHDGTSTTVP
ncbi:MAG: hypothetical protein ACRD1K_16520 [Acidimicrobiales bacterium]